MKGLKKNIKDKVSVVIKTLTKKTNKIESFDKKILINWKSLTSCSKSISTLKLITK